MSDTFTYTRAGAGVKAYMIDIGIRFSHSQFGGRAISGYDAVDGGSADDCNGEQRGRPQGRPSLLQSPAAKAPTIAPYARCATTVTIAVYRP